MITKNRSIEAKFTKKYFRGELKGKIINEVIPFTSAIEAKEWFKHIKGAYDILPYTIDNFEIDLVGR